MAAAAADVPQTIAELAGLHPDVVLLDGVGEGRVEDERRGSMEYRFDGLPNGVYQLELRFAELQNQKPGQRLFDVIAEGSLILPALDVSGEAGRLNALDKTFFMPVTDGTMNVRFIARQGSKEPIINAIRVTERPDRH